MRRYYGKNCELSFNVLEQEYNEELFVEELVRACKKGCSESPDANKLSQVVSITDSPIETIAWT